MGVKSSIQISHPEDTTLQVWRAHSDSLALLKLLNDNPDAITQLSQRIATAYSLTQEEKDQRDAAVAEVAKAKSDLDALHVLQQKAKEDIDQSLYNAELTEAAIKRGSDQYRQEQDDAVKARWGKLDIYKQELDGREIAVNEREKAVQDLEKDKRNHEKSKKEFETKKVAWEEEFSVRLSRLSQEEQAHLKA